MLIVVAGMCWARWAGGRPADPEARALLVERETLRNYLEADEATARAPGPADDAGTDVSEPSARGRSGLVPFGDALVVIRAPLIAELIEAALPFETVVEGRYAVRIDSASVRLRTGLALVSLAGRASLADREEVFADIELVGAFEIARTLEPGAGLGAGISIFGVRTRDVGLGPLSPPAERLVDGLMRSRLEELGASLGRVPIPVRLDEVIELPAVEVDEVTIPAARLDVRFELDAVRVFEQGILVSLMVDRQRLAGPVRPVSDSIALPIVGSEP